MNAQTKNLDRRPLPFVTFEGGEGAGKSTQIRCLAEALRRGGIRVVETREPGGTPFAEAQRAILLDPKTQPQSPLAEALSFYAARADHLAAHIRPALRSGAFVLCDRFSDSTRAYQGAASGVEAEQLAMLDRLAVGETQPGLTVLLDLPAHIGLARADARRKMALGSKHQPPCTEPDGFEGRTLAFHEQLRAGFLAIAAQEPERIVVFDGTLDPNDLANQILATVKARFGQERT